MSEDNNNVNLLEKNFGAYSTFSAQRGLLNQYFRFAGIFIVLDNSSSPPSLGLGCHITFRVSNCSKNLLYHNGNFDYNYHWTEKKYSGTQQILSHHYIEQWAQALNPHWWSYWKQGIERKTPNTRTVYKCCATILWSLSKFLYWQQ